MTFDEISVSLVIAVAAICILIFLYRVLIEVRYSSVHISVTFTYVVRLRDFQNELSKIYTAFNKSSAVAYCEFLESNSVGSSSPVTVVVMCGRVRPDVAIEDIERDLDRLLQYENLKARRVKVSKN